MAPDLAELRRLVQEDALEGIFATGVQLAAIVDGIVVLNEAYGHDGLGGDMTSGHLHRIHCAGKPLCALAIAVLVDDGELSFFDTIRNVLDIDVPAPLADITIDDVLSHRAGLYALRGRDFDTLRPAARRERVLAMTPSPTDRSLSAYSEVAGWTLLAMAIDSLTGESASAFITRRVIEPLGLVRDVLIGTDAVGEDRLAPLAPAVDLNGPTPVPLLGEIAPDIWRSGEPANMVLASMYGLVRLYSSLNEILAGRLHGPISQAALRHLVEPSGEIAWEPILNRRCRYGHGFMVDLAHHQFGERCSTDSFGHSGYLGMASAFCDPTRGLSAAMLYNGAIDGESGIEFRRAARFNSLLAAVDAAQD